MHLSRGTPFIYQGEEIGMTNVPFIDELELRDIESIYYYNLAKEHGEEDFAWQGILKKGRDNARTPMQWDKTLNAGFTDGNPWIKVNPNYETINVEAALKDKNSILNYYRELITLRKNSETLIYGRFNQALRDNKQIFAYIRSLYKESILVLCNMTDSCARFDRPESFSNSVIVLSNICGKTEDNKLLPYEARVMIKSL